MIILDIFLSIILSGLIFIKGLVPAQQFMILTTLSLMIIKFGIDYKREINYEDKNQGIFGGKND